MLRIANYLDTALTKDLLLKIRGVLTYYVVRVGVINIYISVVFAYIGHLVLCGPSESSTCGQTVRIDYCGTLLVPYLTCWYLNVLFVQIICIWTNFLGVWAREQVVIVSP